MVDFAKVKAMQARGVLADSIVVDEMVQIDTKVISEPSPSPVPERKPSRPRKTTLVSTKVEIPDPRTLDLIDRMGRIPRRKLHSGHRATLDELTEVLKNLWRPK